MKTAVVAEIVGIGVYYQQMKDSVNKNVDEHNREEDNGDW